MESFERPYIYYNLYILLSDYIIFTSIYKMNTLINFLQPAMTVLFEEVYPHAYNRASRDIITA